MQSKNTPMKALCGPFRFALFGHHNTLKSHGHASDVNPQWVIDKPDQYLTKWKDIRDTYLAFESKPDPSFNKRKQYIHLVLKAKAAKQAARTTNPLEPTSQGNNKGCNNARRDGEHGIGQRDCKFGSVSNGSLP
jgi:hypothetical protein